MSPQPTLPATMKAVRVHAFGGIDAMVEETVAVPQPGEGEVLVRVAAAGVGPWDAWIRGGNSVLPQPLPLTLGSDLSGTVAAVGAGVSGLAVGDAVYGVTNPRFTGAYAEYALADAGMIAPRPRALSDVEAASVPVVASTAYQMLFDHGGAGVSKTVLVHGGGGSVGAYAVQLAHRAGAKVIATARTRDVEYVRGLGADQVIDVATTRFESVVGKVDLVVDTVGGETLARSLDVVARGGRLISAVAEPDQEKARRLGVEARFILVAVTTRQLAQLTELFEQGALKPRVGDVLPLSDARRAHELLAGKPHKPGKIVLSVAG